MACEAARPARVVFARSLVNVREANADLGRSAAMTPALVIETSLRSTELTYGRRPSLCVDCGDGIRDMCLVVLQAAVRHPRPPVAPPQGTAAAPGTAMLILVSCVLHISDRGLHVAQLWPICPQAPLQGTGPQHLTATGRRWPTSSREPGRSGRPRGHRLDTFADRTHRRPRPASTRAARSRSRGKPRRANGRSARAGTFRYKLLHARDLNLPPLGRLSPAFSRSAAVEARLPLAVEASIGQICRVIMAEPPRGTRSCGAQAPSALRTTSVDDRPRKHRHRHKQRLAARAQRIAQL